MSSKSTCNTWVKTRGRCITQLAYMSLKLMELTADAFETVPLFPLRFVAGVCFSSSKLLPPPLPLWPLVFRAHNARCANAKLCVPAGDRPGLRRSVTLYLIPIPPAFYLRCATSVQTCCCVRCMCCVDSDADKKRIVNWSHKGQAWFDKEDEEERRCDGRWGLVNVTEWGYGLCCSGFSWFGMLLLFDNRRVGSIGHPFTPITKAQFCSTIERPKRGVSTEQAVWLGPYYSRPRRATPCIVTRA